MIRNLGRALTILVQQEVAEIELHDDVDAWHAPSECHRDVARYEAQRAREARKHAEAVARRPLRTILREAKARAGFVMKSNERSYARLFERLYRNPY